MEQQPVYPRWRGEHNVESGALNHYCGLSPLARGTRAAERDNALRCRFIPAGAGNTYCLCRPYRTTPVYPRWRGEHNDARERALICVGLSPLARGTPQELKKVRKK